MKSTLGERAQIAQRWVQQYNFYVNDRRCGRMFVRLSRALHHPLEPKSETQPLFA
jgi:hypothetical protein